MFGFMEAGSQEVEGRPAPGEKMMGEGEQLGEAATVVPLPAKKAAKKTGSGELMPAIFKPGGDLCRVGGGLSSVGAATLRALNPSALSIDSARRQELRHPGGARILATYHPSAILRAENERIEELRTYLVGDLRLAAQIASQESR